MTRSGVPPSIAMSVSGHRTISTFLRYDIASDEDKREALRKVEARALPRRESVRTWSRFANTEKTRRIGTTGSRLEERDLA